MSSDKSEKGNAYIKYGISTQLINFKVGDIGGPFLNSKTNCINRNQRRLTNRKQFLRHIST